jgi:hypothetical protein
MLAAVKRGPILANVESKGGKTVQGSLPDHPRPARQPGVLDNVQAHYQSYPSTPLLANSSSRKRRDWRVWGTGREDLNVESSTFFAFRM